MTATLDCAAPATTGYSCAGSDRPEQTDSSLSCELVNGLGGGPITYCCFSFGGSSSTCVPDSALSCAATGSYAYRCAAGVTPTAVAPSLTNCSADASGDYCCQ